MGFPSREQFDAAVAAMRGLGVGAVSIEDFGPTGMRAYRYAKLDVHSATDEVILRLAHLCFEHRELHLTVWGDRQVSVQGSSNLTEDEIASLPVASRSVG